MNEKEVEKRNEQTTKILGIAISIITIAIGWLFTSNYALSARVDTMSTSYTEIRTQLSQIQTDLVWLKNNSK